MKKTIKDKEKIARIVYLEKTEKTEMEQRLKNKILNYLLGNLSIEFKLTKNTKHEISCRTSEHRWLEGEAFISIIKNGKEIGKIYFGYALDYGGSTVYCCIIKLKDWQVRLSPDEAEDFEEVLPIDIPVLAKQ